MEWKSPIVPLVEMRGEIWALLKTAGYVPIGIFIESDKKHVLVHLEQAL